MTFANWTFSAKNMTRIPNAIGISICANANRNMWFNLSTMVNLGVSVSRLYLLLMCTTQCILYWISPFYNVWKLQKSLPLQLEFRPLKNESKPFWVIFKHCSEYSILLWCCSKANASIFKYRKQISGPSGSQTDMGVGSYVDPTLFAIMGALILMFIVLCVVLQLFAKYEIETISTYSKLTKNVAHCGLFF